jgi:vancomycin aglycone glucosyltransferase
LSTYGSRGDLEPMLGPAVRSRALGAEVRVCAPPDFAEPLARAGVPLVPLGQPVRPPVTAATPPSAADLPLGAAEWVSAQFDTVAAAIEKCHAPGATHAMPTGAWR